RVRVVFAPADAPDGILAGLSAPTALRTRLVRQTISAWRWIRVRLFFKRVLATLGGVVCFLLFLAGTAAVLWNTGYLLPLMFEFGPRQQAKKHPEMLVPA